MINLAINSGLHRFFSDHRALERFISNTNDGLHGISRQARQQPIKTTVRSTGMHPAHTTGPRYLINNSIICTTRASSIWKAFDNKTRTYVAIKEVILPYYQYLINRERNILDRLQSCPSIVRCLNAKEDPFPGYLVLELINGPNLFEIKNLSIIEKLIIMYCLVEIFEEVHKKNIIIRDVKDENIMLAPNRGVVLLDFGHAVDLDNRNDEVNKLKDIGTPEFMAPEAVHLTGLNLSTAADYYSLGVIFYNLFTGIDLRGMRFPRDTNRYYSFYETGDILTEGHLITAPKVIHPPLKALIQRDPKARVSDPDQLKEMLLQAMLQHLEETQS